MISGAICRRVAGARVPKAGRRSLRIVAEAEASSGATERKASPLDRGGSLSGDLAAGKDAGPAATKALKGDRTIMKIIDGRFKDDRWDNKAGRWILSHPMFQNAEGETDWDLVLDAEIERRRMLEATPIPSRNDDPVNFDTSEIPWWAWVKRFHLPEAEKLNGRAAMVGYFMALVVDQLTGAGLLDQQSSFLGKVALTVTVVGILLVRSMEDIDNYRGLIDEATFYDKQWNATWEGRTRPSETQE